MKGEATPRPRPIDNLLPSTMKIKKMSPQQKKRIHFLALAGLLLFIGFITADLLILAYRDKLLPEQAPPKKLPRFDSASFSSSSDYVGITRRNLFSSKGFIPDPLRPQMSEDSPRNDTPIASSLPITILGTLVHTNPAKSVAALEVKSKNSSASYIVGADIEGLAILEKVERGLIYIRNSNNGQLEFIEMNKGNSKVSFDSGAKPTAIATSKNSEIQAIGNNTFKIKKTDLNKYLNDLNSILMQARAIPYRDPATGETTGFKLVDFNPDSIFGQLGIKKGSIIKTANGEKVDSVQKAMELFNMFKTASNIKVGISDPSGTDTTLNYNIE